MGCCNFTPPHIECEEIDYKKELIAMAGEEKALKAYAEINGMLERGGFVDCIAYAGINNSFYRNDNGKLLVDEPNGYKYKIDIRLPFLGVVDSIGNLAKVFHYFN